MQREKEGEEKERAEEKERDEEQERAEKERKSSGRRQRRLRSRGEGEAEVKEREEEKERKEEEPPLAMWRAVSSFEKSGLHCSATRNEVRSPFCVQSDNEMPNRCLFKIFWENKKDNRINSYIYI
jgi:hypothetical protein